MDEKVVHLDIKCQNIFLDNIEQIYLGDFGIAQCLQKNEDTFCYQKGVGTLHYLAPECLAEETMPTGPKVDVWSAGIVIYQLLYGRHPYSSGAKNLKEMREKTQKEKVVYEDRDKFYVIMNGFLKKCLKINYKERFTALEA